MENTFSVKMIFHFYHSVVKAELKRRGFPKEVAKKIEEEHGKIVARAKDIGKSKLLSSYIMASYYIAMNRSTGKSAQENFEIFRDGLCASKLFHKVMGDVDSYLDPKKMPGRLKWSEDSHKRLYENDWVNMTLGMIITSAVRASFVRTRGVLNWRLTYAKWTLCWRT